jgi:hypothetical protein
MNYRFVVSAGVLAVLIAVVLSPATRAAGQATSAAAGTNRTAAKAYTPPRTPDGQPDLQGFWTNQTYTPLQRPNNVTKEFYTEEEAAEFERRRGAADGRELADPPATPGEWLAAGPAAVPRPGTIADVHYDFSQFGLDRSQTTLARTLRTSLIVDPPDGKIPPMTAEGRKRVTERAEANERTGGRWASAQNNELDDRCIIMGAGPPMLPTGYNSNYQILQGPGYVMILVEMIHDARIIPLDGRPRAPQTLRQWMGISRGRWEGNTLVVETRNFNGKNPFRGASENLRVTERFTRVAADTILYTFTVEDETTWVRPWSAEVPLQRAQGPLFEHACHEGNYGLSNTLAGARAEEKRAAEEAAKKKGAR